MQVSFERSQKEYDVLDARFKKLQIDFEQQLIACEQLNNENQTKASELKVSKLVLLFSKILIIILTEYMFFLYFLQFALFYNLSQINYI